MVSWLYHFILLYFTCHSTLPLYFTWFYLSFHPTTYFTCHFTLPLILLYFICHSTLPLPLHKQWKMHIFYYILTTDVFVGFPSSMRKYHWRVYGLIGTEFYREIIRSTKAIEKKLESQLNVFENMIPRTMTSFQQGNIFLSV